MKIVAIKNNDYSLGKNVFHKEETLIVEMSQEEYQKCCAILFGKELEE